MMAIIIPSLPAAPVASFDVYYLNTSNGSTWDPLTTGNATKAVLLSFNASTGGATSWSWDFGDGNSSALQNPSHTFVSNGEYQVNLTVTNGFGSSSKLRNITVSDFSSSFTGTPLAGPSPLTVSFTETTPPLII